ncbi:tRNA synthetases class I (M) [Clostridium frigidicarnis]|uniref:methionine--tRNA ligase n=1 Tax=Clostridium frigidicarnis TaxID=84698 RepID=A0A1I0YER9_9CLOT|nr:tRNA synthetases class I (M) [Clostridium frigidicarnis]
MLGKCPKCGEDARGDQCDACGKVLEPEILENPICSVCGNTPIFKESKHLYIAISKLEKNFQSLLIHILIGEKMQLTFQIGILKRVFRIEQ